jgi:DNA-binding MarR family transcriptional regulator
MPKKPADEIDALMLVAHRIEGEVERLLTSNLKLTYARYRVLDFVARHPKCSRIDIADAFGSTQSNVTAIMPRLLKSGLLVELNDGLGTRRSRRLELSDKGYELVAEARDHRNHVRNKVAKAVGLEGLDALKSLSIKIFDALTQKEVGKVHAKR